MYRCDAKQNVQMLCNTKCTDVAQNKLYRCCAKQNVQMLCNSKCTYVVQHKMYRCCVTQSVQMLRNTKCTDDVQIKMYRCHATQNVQMLCKAKCTDVVQNKMYRCCAKQNVHVVQNKMYRCYAKQNVQMLSSQHLGSSNGCCFTVIQCQQLSSGLFPPSPQIVCPKGSKEMEITGPHIANWFCDCLQHYGHTWAILCPAVSVSSDALWSSCQVSDC
jgi:hypothetical protein